MKLCRQKRRLGIPGFARNAKSGFEPTKFVAFPGNASNFVGSAGSTLFEQFPGNAAKNVQKKFRIRNGAQKKVPESAGLAGRSRPRLGSPGNVLAQT